MLPDDWREVRFEEIGRGGARGLTDGPFGSAVRQADYVPVGVPVLRGVNLTLGTQRLVLEDLVFIREELAEKHSRAIVVAGDVIFTKKGTLGSVGIIPNDSPWPRLFISSNQMKATIDPAVAEPLFIYYVFAAKRTRNRLIQEASITGVPKINLSYLRNFALALPPLPEQRRIAAILCALDDKIELNRKMNRTLEEIAQAIFKSWFIDFDGHDDLVESELGMIPQGWEVSPISELVDFNPRTPLQRGELAPFVDMKSLPTAGCSVARVARKEFKSGGAKFQQGDTLFARITPCLENGKTAIVDFLAGGERGFGSTEFIVMRPRQPVTTEWVYCLSRLSEFRRFAISNMTGSSGRQRVPVGSFDHFRVAVPDEVTATRYADVAVPCFRRITAASAESRTLAQLRDTLLPKLISGEIRVPEAEELVEGAV